MRQFYLVSILLWLFGCSESPLDKDTDLITHLRFVGNAFEQITSEKYRDIHNALIELEASKAPQYIIETQHGLQTKALKIKDLSDQVRNSLDDVHGQGETNSVEQGKLMYNLRDSLISIVLEYPEIVGGKEKFWHVDFHLINSLHLVKTTAIDSLLSVAFTNANMKDLETGRKIFYALTDTSQLKSSSYDLANSALQLNILHNRVNMGEYYAICFMHSRSERPRFNQNLHERMFGDPVVCSGDSLSLQYALVLGYADIQVKYWIDDPKRTGAPIDSAFISTGSRKSYLRLPSLSEGKHSLYGVYSKYGYGKVRWHPWEYSFFVLPDSISG